MNPGKDDTSKIALGAISNEAIAKLTSDKPTAEQMDVVEKLTELYSAEREHALDPRELHIAHDIFRLLLKRGGVLVRALLAMNLSFTSKLPPSLAKEMAHDVSEVAGPILQYSDVLTDEDLLHIIHSFVDAEKLEAIARRESVSNDVSDALVNTGIDPVIDTLLKNEGAQIAEHTFDIILKYHSGNSELIESIIQRNAVPESFLQTLIEYVPVALRRKIEKKYEHLTEMQRTIRQLGQNLEKTTRRLLEFKSSDTVFQGIIEKLDRNGNLLPLSAILSANLELFELSLSHLLRIPLTNVHILLQDPVGFKIAYEKVNLPGILFEPMVLAIRAIRKIEREKVWKTEEKILCTSSQMQELMHQLSEGQKIEGLYHFYQLIKYCSV